MSWFEDELRGVNAALVARSGLQALEPADRSRVQVADTRALVGSCAMDGDLRAAEPTAARWDYAVGHGESVWFVEVHPASTTGAASEVIAKARWLQEKLRGSELAARSRGLHWIASGRVTTMLPFGSLRRRLAQAGVAGPVEHLRIPG